MYTRMTTAIERRSEIEMALNLCSRDKFSSNIESRDKISPA